MAKEQPKPAAAGDSWKIDKDKIDKDVRYTPAHGEPVLCHLDDADSRKMPFLGFVTHVQHGRRLSVVMVGKDMTYFRPTDDCLPDDDPQFKGKFPTYFRWEPAPHTVRILALEAEVARLRGLIDGLPLPSSPSGSPPVPPLTPAAGGSKAAV